MEALKDIQSKTYDYTSRYASFKFGYNINDNKYIYELTAQLDDSTPCVVHTVTKTDTLDYLANKYYGRPDLYWIIADFNRIQDPFIQISDYFTEINIPTFTTIEYKD